MKMWERRHFLLFFLVALSLTLFIYLSPLYSQLQLSSSPSPFSSSSSSPSPTASRQTTTGRGEWRNTCLLTVTTKQNNTCVDGGTRRHEVALASGAACLGQALTSADHQVVASHMFSEAELREQFTVVILTMAKRVKMLNRVLREYDGLPAIAEIIVVMNGLNESHVSSRLGVTKTPISFVNNSINSLNIRFAVVDRVKTEAVLSNDDDLFYTPESAEYLFRIWQRHRRSIVGDSPRFSGDGTYEFDGHPCLNVVLTNSAFVPTALMRQYSEPTAGPVAQLRAHVDEHTNCEDIGINFVAAASTEPEMVMDPPVSVSMPGGWANERLMATLINHQAGLSSQPAHYTKRANCGKAFMGFFGRLGLPNIRHTYTLQQHLDHKL